jgi:hypothetical protein
MQDKEVMQPMQVFFNGKFLMVIDGFQIIENSKLAKPELKGRVLNLVKNDPLQVREHLEQKRDLAESEYAKWYQEAVNNVRNKEYIEWKVKR